MTQDLWSLLWKILVPIVFTALTLLLTGPGMWSDKWGWSWMKKLERPPPSDER